MLPCAAFVAKSLSPSLSVLAVPPVEPVPVTVPVVSVPPVVPYDEIVSVVSVVAVAEGAVVLFSLGSGFLEALGTTRDAAGMRIRERRFITWEIPVPPGE